MEFAIGQNIVHPAHGAGEIVDIEEMELVSGFNKYYVIEFIGKRLVMRVPTQRVEELGMREVMSKKRFQRVLKVLRDIEGKLPKNFKERRRMVADLINSGLPAKIAEAVRELTWRRKAAHLTKSDMELLSEGRERLIAEIALAIDTDLSEARQRIDDVLSEAVQSKSAKMEMAA